MHVELNGLYTEGIYRKSGSACRAKELHQVLQKSKKLMKVEMHEVSRKTILQEYKF